MLVIVSDTKTWLAVLISLGVVISVHLAATSDDASGFDPHPDMEKYEESSEFVLIQTSVGPAPYVKRIKHLPTWVFHGAKDAVIPCTNRSVW